MLAYFLDIYYRALGFFAFMSAVVGLLLGGGLFIAHDDEVAKLGFWILIYSAVVILVSVFMPSKEFLSQFL